MAESLLRRGSGITGHWLVLRGLCFHVRGASFFLFLGKKPVEEVERFVGGLSMALLCAWSQCFDKSKRWLPTCRAHVLVGKAGRSTNLALWVAAALRPAFEP